MEQPGARLPQGLRSAGSAQAPAHRGGWAALDIPSEPSPAGRVERGRSPGRGLTPTSESTAQVSQGRPYLSRNRTRLVSKATRRGGSPAGPAPTSFPRGAGLLWRRERPQCSSETPVNPAIPARPPLCRGSSGRRGGCRAAHGASRN